MPRNINDTYNLFRDIVRKQRGVFIKIPQFNEYMDAGQMDAFGDYFKPYGETQVLHDALRKFIVYYRFDSDAAGFVTFPSDYEHILGAAFTVYGSAVNEITFVNGNEWVFAINSQQRAVSFSNPIAKDTNNGFSLYPQATQTGFFDYLRRPATPVLAVTTSGRDVTYDPGNSVQLEWSDSYVNNIIAKALKYAGVNMDEPAVSEFAQIYDQQSKP